MSRLLAASLVLLLAVSAPAGAAHSRITTLIGDMPRWLVMPVAYQISGDGSSQIPNGSEFAAAQAAMAAWENVADASVDFNYQGTAVSGNVGLDGINLITFEEDSGILGTTTLAATFSFFQGSGSNFAFREADIAFNPIFDITTSGEPGKFDIQSVLTHEVGHLLGLDHTGLVSSVMGPFAVRDQANQRVLQYDDMAGIRGIYPPPPFSGPPMGRIVGNVRSTTGPVTGANVVAITSDGTVMVSTMSDLAGNYYLGALPPGDYRVYAEPFDGPVTTAHVPSFFQPSTGFGTTFLGNTPTLTGGTIVTVAASQVVTGQNIDVLGRGTTGLNFRTPNFAQHVSRGGSDTLEVGGDNVRSGVVFSVSDARVELGSPTFGGRMSGTAPTSADVPVTLPADVPLGPKVLLGVSGNTMSLVGGMFVVTEARPEDIAVFPVSGSFDGGTVVQVTGRNFRPGVRVYFGGLEASDLELLSDSMLQATAPANAPGPSNVTVFNSDGTSGLLIDAFEYIAPPPSVSSVTPSMGAAGTPVVIEGANFDTRPHNVIVTFNGRTSRVIQSTRTRIETVVPFGAESGPLEVSLFGAVAAGGDFTVIQVPPSENAAPAQIEQIDGSSGGGGVRLTFPSNDDGIFFFELPFTFGLFTDTFIAGEPLSVSTNGWISLDGASSPEFQNASLPAVNSERPSGSQGSIGRALIAPFFDDLTFDGGGEVSRRTIGTAPNRKLVIQWTRASILDEVGTNLNADLTFKLVLYEGSNDIRFIYDGLTGGRSDGSSATVGMQNLARNQAVESGYNMPILSSGLAITYRFDDGAYVEESNRQDLPLAPVVTDGGARTASLSELIASWTDPSPTPAVAYEYAVGRTPGGTDVRGFQLIAANSVVASGLSLIGGETYYVAVRGRNAAGAAGPAGVSDGILVDTTFTPSASYFPTVSGGASLWGGIALMAEEATDIVLRAVDPEGNLPQGLGIRNPTMVHLEAGEQVSRLVSEIFGLGVFDGWVELASSRSTLRSFTTTGAHDLRFVDGAAPSPALTDFYLLHEFASALVVNPGTVDVTARIELLADGQIQTLLVPARSRRSMPLVDGPVHVTAPLPLAAVESFGDENNLAFGGPVTGSSTTLVFPHGVVGGGYESWVTLVNQSVSPAAVRVAFGGQVWDPGSVPGNGTLRFPLSVAFDDLAGVVDDAVRIFPTSPFVSQAIAGIIDIALPTTLVTLAAGPASTSVVFPHVADLGGFFTGIALATGSTPANVTVEVYRADGVLSGSSVVTVPANGQIADLVHELVPGFPGQNGGYIRINSDTPIWTWEIYGTLEAMASGPPL